ncbi:MAG: transcription antitermination factor NusB [Firmicutes bacterium]|nr:transcription antitermination factor NusB [Candidatus Caballimonas caccae]
MRSLARECVLKYLFAKFFNPGDEELFAVLLKDEKLTKDDCDFAQCLLDNIEKNQEVYFSKIEEKVKSFSFNRIFPIDKLCISIGLCELENFKDTPVPVIIDEAVKLSAKFSTEKSPDFVNGVLSKMALEIRNV